LAFVGLEWVAYELEIFFLLFFNNNLKMKDSSCVLVLDEKRIEGKKKWGSK
jgi:hypothetical protein